MPLMMIFSLLFLPPLVRQEFGAIFVFFNAKLNDLLHTLTDFDTTFIFLSSCQHTYVQNIQNTPINLGLYVGIIVCSCAVLVVFS